MKMLRLTIFIVANLLSPSLVTAQAGKGAPEELVGYYGGTRDECRSFNRKSDEITIINKGDMSWCGGSACGAEIVNHVRQGDRYRLRLRSGGNPKGWTSTYRLIENEILEEITIIDGRKMSKTLARCAERDIRAGIGRRTETPGLTKGPDHVFAAFYAVAAIAKCPDLAPEQGNINLLADLGRLEWIRFLGERKLGVPGRPLSLQGHDLVISERASARGAVASDSDKLTTFCEDVVSAFGERGSVAPSLVVDKRKRA